MSEFQVPIERSNTDSVHVDLAQRVSPHGVLVVDKPKGHTCASLGRLLGKALRMEGLGRVKIGHAGIKDDRSVSPPTLKNDILTVGEVLHLRVNNV